LRVYITFPVLLFVVVTQSVVFGKVSEKVTVIAVVFVEATMVAFVG